MSAEMNKQISLKYHELSANPDSWDEIMTAGFVGHHTDGRTWNLDSHKRFWTENAGIVDTIHDQVAEDDLVSTRFTRKGMYRGSSVEIEVMHLKRFEDGKIAEIWEYFDRTMLNQ